MMSLVRVQLEEFAWPLGQVVKTPPFHGDNMGSNPVGVIKMEFRQELLFFCQYGNSNSWRNQARLENNIKS